MKLSVDQCLAFEITFITRHNIYYKRFYSSSELKYC